MRRRQLRSFVLLLALGAAASCSSPTQPSSFPASVEVVRIYGSLPPVTVTTAPGTIRVTGAIVMNVPCYRFTSTASGQHDTLVVTLIAIVRGEICTQDVAAFSYTITVIGVRSGLLPMRLVYDRYGLPEYAEIALEQTVLVP